MASTEPLYALLLAGGNSTRMGEPKHTLRFPNGDRLGARMLALLDDCGQFQRIVISCRTQAQAEDFRSFKQHRNYTLPMEIIFDPSAHGTVDGDATGPAAGLLAAHWAFPHVYWMVLACDYPLVQPGMLAQLRMHYQDPVTCFKNADGYCEPLIGIWSPTALKQLAHNSEQGNCGPSSAVKQLRGKLLTPMREAWLFNVNTPQQWQAALGMLGKTLCGDVQSRR